MSCLATKINNNLTLQLFLPARKMLMGPSCRDLMCINLREEKLDDEKEGTSRRLQPSSGLRRRCCLMTWSTQSRLAETTKIKELMFQSIKSSGGKC